ncbi:hypothetical protein L6R52_00310, partial [Myxococcota bacterium]|nr:hypothetical protein [Myxococcota bacterium]
VPPAAALVATAGPRMAPTPVMLVPSASQAYPPLAQAERGNGTNKLLTAVVLLATVLAVAAAVTLLLERGKPINAIAIRPEKGAPAKAPEPAKDPEPTKTAGTVGGTEPGRTEPTKPDELAKGATDAKDVKEAEERAKSADTPEPAKTPRPADDEPSDDARASRDPERPAGGATEARREVRDPSVGVERVAPEEARAESAAPKKTEPAKRPAPKKAQVREASRPRPVAADPTMGLISIECAEPATVTVLGKGKFPNVTRQAIKVEPGAYLLVITRNGTKLKSVTVNAIAGQVARISCDN